MGKPMSDDLGDRMKAYEAAETSRTFSSSTSGEGSERPSWA